MERRSGRVGDRIGRMTGTRLNFGILRVPCDDLDSVFFRGMWTGNGGCRDGGR